MLNVLPKVILQKGQLGKPSVCRSNLSDYAPIILRDLSGQNTDVMDQQILKNHYSDVVRVQEVRHRRHTHCSILPAVQRVSRQEDLGKPSWRPVLPVRSLG